MSDTPPALRIERARELFFAQQRDPDAWVAPHISRSWRRSVPVGGQFADTAPLSRERFSERREQALRLLECARPELDGLAEHAVGHGCVVVLTDAGGLILEEIGAPEFLPQAERYALTPGVEWSEVHRGTNAIGTALAEREALMVLGGEHYLPQNGALGCAAAPIFSGRGDIVGVLDISGEAVRVNQHALGLVRMAAQQVEHRLMLAPSDLQLLRFHRHPDLLGSAREGLVAIEGGRVVGVSRSALAMLGASWKDLLGRDAAALAGADWERLVGRRGLLTLPGGQQIAATIRGAQRVVEARAASPRTVSASPSAPPSPAPDDLAPLLAQAVRVLDAGVSVLVQGETGSGKDVFVRRLHAACGRRAGPLVAVNCAALPESLIEAELFGYEEGAFTGARRRGMPGRIREAEGGLLFLDEIADMPLTLQTRLLRVLEDRQVIPLGGGAPVKVDFALVCATNGYLAALAAAGRFRTDLLYRVVGYSVAIPPLRARRDRRSLIARLFEECGGAARDLQLDSEALDLLCAWRWPGNVRELRSALQAIAALAEPGERVLPSALPPHLRGVQVDERPAGAQTGFPAEPAPDAIEQALRDSHQNVAKAAQRLGVHRSTVYRHRARAAAGSLRLPTNDGA